MHRIFGETVEGPLTRTRVEELLRRARERCEPFERVSVRRILRILDRVGRAWGDPAFPPRARAQAELPELLGLSPEMVRLSLDLLSAALGRDALELRARRELGPLELLDRFFPQGRVGQYLRARPRGVVLTVASGNVFVGSAVLLAESLLAGNVTLLKVSSGDPLFARLFVESLAGFEEDGELTRSTAVLSWPGGDDELECLFKTSCDTVVITGGEEAVRRYRQGLGPGVEVVDYGPKLSLAVLTAGVEDLPDVAARLARDVSMWDQNACSSPQVLYVEGVELAERLLPLLQEALEESDRTLPAATPSFDTAVEVTKEREMARFAAAVRPVRLLTSSRPHAWTLIYEPDDPILRPSPLHRTLLVKC
ncbi:MAG: acyl-CoA reductase, partial [Candidatus Eremiobacterota bacterium]